MKEKCFTTCEQIYFDEANGDLIYETDATNIRHVPGKLIIKIKMPKYFNWMQLADAVRCETRMIGSWGNELLRKGIKSWDDLSVIVSDVEFEEQYEDFPECVNDSELFTYFYDDKNWVMYENDDEYLFLYETPSDNQEVSTNDIDAIIFTPDDKVGSILAFLRSWYERVNGYKKKEDK